MLFLGGSAKKPKVQSQSQAQGEPERTKLWQCALAAKQQFGVMFVLNLFSRKLHTADALGKDGCGKTRGCRWSFQADRVHVFSSLDDLRGVSASACEGCLPQAITTDCLVAQASKEVASERIVAFSPPVGNVDAGSDSDQEHIVSSAHERSTAMVASLNQL